MLAGFCNRMSWGRFVKRQSLVARVALAGLLLGVSACGGNDDEKADPKPTEPTSTQTTASPTPTTPVQPKGADGVTYDVLNWETYAEDPVVMAYKVTNEALTASINRRTVLPALRQGVDKAFLRTTVSNMKFVEQKRWHVPNIASVKVEDVSTTGSKAVLTVCVWRPSYGYYDKNNKIVGTPDRWWDKQITRLTKSGERWVVTSVDTKGKCPGGAPK
jgi:hypothetical protein